MKTVKQWSRMLVMGAAVVFSATMTGCSRNGAAEGPLQANYVVSGNASGSQVVPAVSGNGTATISGKFNPRTNVLDYTVNWTGLSGAPTMGAFYNGMAGTAGTIAGNNWTLGTGLTSNGTVTSSTTLNAMQVSQLLSGGLYYTLGTAAHTGGEVRGQIVATQ